MNSVAPEQQEIIDDLRTTVRSAVSRVEAGTGDASTWQVLAEQIGAAGLLVPEDHGGLGLGAREVAAVAEELGASAVRVPFLSHAVAATTLLRTAEADSTREHSREVVGALLSDAATSRRRIAVVHGAGNGVTVDSTPGAGRLRGTATAVDAPDADVLLVTASFNGDEVVCLVEVPAPDLDVTEHSALDLSRSVGTVIFDGTPATVLLAGATARSAIDASRRWSHLALAADQVGIARRALEVTVEYVGIRTQFGAVIGSFQAVKHRCTDVLLELELARALVEQAAGALDGGDDPQDLVSTAALQAGTAAFAASDAAIQLHGGIGFTWEHVAHHYFRRARSNANLLGPEQALREAVAASVGL